MQALHTSYTQQLCLLSPAELVDALEQNGDSRFDIFSSSRLCVPGLHPPVLLQDNRIVWGFGYIRAAAQADSVPALAVAEIGALTPAETVMTVLQQESRCDSYSFSEMDAVDQLLEQLGLSEDEKRQIDPLIQTKGSFRAHVAQYRGLSPMLKAAVNNGKLDVRTAVGLEGLPETVIRQAVAARIGFSKRRIILTRLNEIYRRDTLTAEHIQDVCSAALADDDPSRYLLELRYPELTVRQRAADELNQRLCEGFRIQVNLPDNLEGDSVTVICRVGSAAEMEAQLGALSAVREHINEYLDLL